MNSLWLLDSWTMNNREVLCDNSWDAILSLVFEMPIEEVRFKINRRAFNYYTWRDLFPAYPVMWTKCEKKTPAPTGIPVIVREGKRFYGHKTFMVPEDFQEFDYWTEYVRSEDYPCLKGGA